MVEKLNFHKIAVIILALFILAGSASATKLTFDITPAPASNYYDIGHNNFTTVYGDRGATGSVGSLTNDGSTYLYDGGTADTPNIQIDYGHIQAAYVNGDQQWWANPGTPRFYSTGFGSLTNVLNPADGYQHAVIMFKPDTNYGVTVNSLDVASWGGSNVDMRVVVWESIGDALDISTYGASEYPVYVENVDYKELYYEVRGSATNETFNPNVSSGKIIWLLIDVPNSNSGMIALDNIDFDQNLIDTCAEIHQYGMAMPADFIPDCGINFLDFEALAEKWQLDYDPHEVFSFGGSDELLIDGVAKLPFGVYGMYPGLAGHDSNDLVGELVANELWANQTYILDYKANPLRIGDMLDEAANAGSRLLCYPFPRDVYDKIAAGTVGSTLTPPDETDIVNYVNQFKESYGLLGWYLADEPEGNSVALSWYQDAYQAIKNADQYNHPVVITNNSLAGVTNYSSAADVMMPNPYPLPLITNGDGYRGGSQLDYVIPFIDAGIAAGKPTWFVPQLFNYALFTESLSGTRAPTYEELRATIFGAIVHGAKGSVGYSYADTTVSPECEIGYKYIAREVRKLRNPINIGADQSASSSNSDIHVLSRQYGNELVTIVVNTTNSDISGVTITQPQASGTLHVLSEGRTVSPSAGSFTDNFVGKANYVHIYTSQSYLAEPIADVQAEIDAAIAFVDADNVGNLAYAGGGAVVDSEDYVYRLALNDGYYNVEDGGAAYNFESNGTTSTDYIEVTLPAAADVGYVWVYSESQYYPNQVFENYTITVHSLSQGWQTVKVNAANTETIMKAGPTDITYNDVDKVRFEGLPVSDRAINEIRIWLK